MLFAKLSRNRWPLNERLSRQLCLYPFNITVLKRSTSEKREYLSSFFCCSSAFLFCLDGRIVRLVKTINTPRNQNSAKIASSRSERLFFVCFIWLWWRIEGEFQAENDICMRWMTRADWWVIEKWSYSIWKTQMGTNCWEGDIFFLSDEGLSLSFSLLQIRPIFNELSKTCSPLEWSILLKSPAVSCPIQPW